MRADVRSNYGAPCARRRPQPPGPVHFEFPQSETTTQAADLLMSPRRSCRIWLTPGPDALPSTRSLERVARARKPILLAGLGVLLVTARRP